MSATPGSHARYVLAAASISAAVVAASVLGRDSGRTPTPNLLPRWEPTYRMNASTAFMPCNSSGFYDASFAARWGIADFDWSNGKQVWANQKPMNCEEMLVEQVQKIHAINPSTRTFVYRNLVKALPWFSSVREKLDDPAYSGFFLRFKPGGFFPNGSYHVPACTGSKCSVFYHDQDQTPEHPSGDGDCTDECDCGTQPCGEYLWDHRNGTMLRDFLVNEFVLGPTGMGAPGVGGFYFDDVWSLKPNPHDAVELLPGKVPPEGFCSNNSFGGPSEEDRWCVDDMGLNASDVLAIHDEWLKTIDTVYAAVVEAGGFAWQLFHHIAAPTDTARCKAFFRYSCRPNGTLESVAMMMPWTIPPNRSTGDLLQPDVDLASFLLTRGPYAWMGYWWEGCTDSSRTGGGFGPYLIPESTQLDYGVPQGSCAESSAGVFSREWSKASVSMDCSSMTPTITMK